MRFSDLKLVLCSVFLISSLAGSASAEQCYPALLKVIFPSKIKFPKEDSVYSSLLQFPQRDVGAIDVPELKRIVQKILDGDKVEVYEKVFLQDNRKTTQTLRSAYKILTSDHLVPQDYDELVKAFGNVKDHVWVEGSLKKRHPELLDDARTFQAMLDNEMVAPIENPATRESVLEYQLKTAQRISHFLASPEISIEEYHHFRKVVRDNQYLFEMLQEQSASKKTKKIAKSLARLSKYMDQDRGILKKGIKKSTGASEVRDALVSLDPELRSKLDEFLQMLNASLVRN